jgi:hypothetical protein
MERGINVAMVYAPSVPTDWNVIDGDLSDLRFLDPPNSIVGLKAKGKAKKDQSGFVIYI